MSKIAVVGDSMVDEDYRIEANRISPEFPIPVLLSSDDAPEFQYPGGAANVAFQLINMGAKTTLAGVIDTEAKKIFNKHGITDKHLCFILSDHKIPRKKRFYNGDFPLCRWDVEKKYSDLGAAKQIFESIIRIDPKIVVLSDYNKGFFPDKKSKQMWINNSWITIVDPKSGNLEDWKGCDVFKPNFKEATELTKTSNWKQQLHIIKEVTNCKFALITNGNTIYGYHGDTMWEKSNGNQTAKYPIGAGDCFVAALARAIVKELDYEAAAEEAYRWGEAYVNTPKRYVNPYDVDKKIATLSEIAKTVAVNPNMKFVFTNGCFDILHEQHINLLKYAKSKGDALIVALNNDESVAKLKGENRPINSLEQRTKVIEALGCVDYVTSFDDDTPLRAIQEIKPWAIVKGGDYQKEAVVGYTEVNGNVFLFPYKEGVSTSSIIKKATSG